MDARLGILWPQSMGVAGGPPAVATSPGGRASDAAGVPAVRVDELIDRLSPAASPPAGRPYVMLNMICTADGRATVGGRSGPLGSPADRELFHGLRRVVDAVLIGAQTLRAERYNRLVADPARRLERARRGLAEEPLACVVSGSLDLDPSIPLLADPHARVAVLTASAGELPGAAAALAYVRAGKEGVLDLAGCLAELRSRFAVRTLLCEGGPHLAGELLAHGLLDELFLTLSPMLAAGPITSRAPAPGEALSLLSGPAMDPPARLELLSALEAESYLFLRYRRRH